MADMPNGTVTFLFTDIEGSTRLWEQNPVEMSVALARHDALLRETIERNAGYVFKTIGDAFCAAFPTASAAVTAARDAQLTLAREPWPQSAPIKVRMALHTGASEVTEDDYFGQPLNRVARLLTAGHGGQVLLSLATQELVRDDLPAGVSCRDLGERRLKDLVRPERVYQLSAEGLPADFPALKTLDARAHNLPIQLTSLVGRGRETQEVETLLESARLVTLTGAGGVGKTRLSLQVGADLVDEFADGVWFVQLAQITDPRLVPQAVAAVLAIRERPDETIAHTVTKATRDQELLLILDNCEHLVEASALLCDAMLSSCARVRILVTSREVLRVTGETVYPVPALATPDPKLPVHVASLTQYAAVQLFIDRAKAVKPTFHVNNANAPAVAGICFHLDGIPLAIELAAARVRSMSVEELYVHLDERFRLLTGGSRTALPRQQTLRALIDWSYELLSEAEKSFFCRISVFSGGWTLAAAEQVCSDKRPDEGAVLDRLTALVDKNLVAAEERNASTRYRLLESTHEYARERLRESGEEAHWKERHVACYVELVKANQPRWTFADQPAALARLETEHDNMRSALDWCSEPTGDLAAGLSMAAGLSWFWDVRGHLAEGRSWLESMLASNPVGQDRLTRAQALAGAGGLAMQQGDYTAAKAMYEAGLAINREMGDQHNIGAFLISLGNLALYEGDNQSTRDYYEQSLAIFRELDDKQGIGVSIGNLANVAFAMSEIAAARPLYAESLAIYRELGDQSGIATSLGNLGNLAAAEGDHSTARKLHKESLAVHRELGSSWGIAVSLEALADAAFALSETGRAARLWGSAERLRESTGAPLPAKEQPKHETQICAARAVMGDDATFDLAWEEGRAMTLEQAIEYALDRKDM